MKSSIVTIITICILLVLLLLPLVDCYYYYVVLLLSLYIDGRDPADVTAPRTLGAAGEDP